jgi:hypothetical protein
MNIQENKPETAANALMAAWLSLGGPLMMVLLAALLPRDNPPLHPVNNSWYFLLTAFVCFCSIVSAGWALTHRKNGSAAIPAIAILGILV